MREQLEQFLTENGVTTETDRSLVFDFLLALPHDIRITACKALLLSGERALEFVDILKKKKEFVAAPSDKLAKEILKREKEWLAIK